MSLARALVLTHGMEISGQFAQLGERPGEGLRPFFDPMLKLVIRLPHHFLRLLALGDIDERNYCANHYAIFNDRVRGILGGEARTIRAPQHL